MNERGWKRVRTKVDVDVFVGDVGDDDLDVVDVLGHMYGVHVSFFFLLLLLRPCRLLRLRLCHHLLPPSPSSSRYRLHLGQARLFLLLWCVLDLLN